MKKYATPIPAIFAITFFLMTITNRDTVVPFVQELANTTEDDAVFIVVWTWIGLFLFSAPFLRIGYLREAEEIRKKRTGKSTRSK